MGIDQQLVCFECSWNNSHCEHLTKALSEMRIQKSNPKATPAKDGCKCPCHRTGAKHCVPCCGKRKEMNQELEVLHTSGQFHVTGYDIDADRWATLCETLLAPTGPTAINIECSTCGFRSHDQVIFDHHSCAEVTTAASTSDWM